jgi:hypothetical protein
MPRRRLPAIWTFRQGLWVLLSFLALLFALTAAHMLWVKHAIGFPAYLGEGPRLPPKLLTASQLIKAVAIVAALWLVALRRRGFAWDVLGLRRCEPRWLALAAGAALLGFVLIVLLAKLLVAAVPDWARHSASRYAWGDTPPAEMLALAALTVLVTPLVEELFFRGFLFRWMASHRPLWLAIAVSSLMFGASHVVPSQAIVAAAMSVLITLLYLGSGSIWPSVLCHALNNALGVGFGMAAAAGLLPAGLTPPGA